MIPNSTSLVPIALIVAVIAAPISRLKRLAVLALVTRTGPRVAVLASEAADRRVGTEAATVLPVAHACPKPCLERIPLRNRHAAGALGPVIAAVIAAPVAVRVTISILTVVVRATVAIGAAVVAVTILPRIALIVTVLVSSLTVVSVVIAVATLAILVVVHAAVALVGAIAVLIAILAPIYVASLVAVLTIILILAIALAARIAISVGIILILVRSLVLLVRGLSMLRVLRDRIKCSASHKQRAQRPIRKVPHLNVSSKFVYDAVQQPGKWHRAAAKDVI